METSVIPSSSKRKRKQEKDLYLVKRPAHHVSGTCASQQPAFYRGPAGWFSGKGPFRFIVQGERVWLPAHLTASVCSSFQHPGDGLPPSARVAALPPVWRLRAADRGAAQATPPGALRDGRQPRGREGSDGRPPCRPGMGSRSLPLVSSWATGPLASAGLLFGAGETAERVSASYSSKGWEV